MSAGLLIVADDLSGAADCAAGFARRLSTRVLLDGSAARLSEVTALDLDTRRLTPREAARANRAIVESGACAGLALYKKIDSTLRGNVAAEVAALGGRGMALVAPAFPAMGRTTRGAVQYVDGVPVDRSDVWSNEHLTGSAHLVTLLEAQGLRCAHLDLEQVRASGTLEERLRQHLLDGVHAVIGDAETDADLQALAQASAPLRERLYWVGSAGLAQHLPAALGYPAERALEANPQGPILTVVGSMSRHSQGQAEYLLSRSGQAHERLDPRLLLAAGRQADREALAERLRARLASGADLLVSLAQEHRDPAQATLLSASLARLLQGALGEAGSLIATGGETARAVLSAAGIDALRVHGELLPGVVLSSAAYQGRRLGVVTKAGGFGQPDTLQRAWSALQADAATRTDTPFTLEEPQHV
ncbi:four-carbon acid sugar kinase family protein [Phytopseudomonas dryadis]|uniref:Type III effector n=1 Tax=Phytopseudomonas dryadis TaxID=2487520 RepID=A0ABY1Z5Z7_9GAMM|nr:MULTISPECIES: four-carbon acid sugar kinase family protein [Pseudomonas]TBV03280.1 type III effector [Pseudomonas dryadis]TBV16346.1 type III effector [Pseudomonas sp. FRB 230]